MNATIEYNGERAIFNPQMGYLRTENWVAVPAQAKVELCAWCDTDKSLTKNITRAGYEISHGICKDCRAELERKSA